MRNLLVIMCLFATVSSFGQVQSVIKLRNIDGTGLFDANILSPLNSFQSTDKQFKGIDKFKFDSFQIKTFTLDPLQNKYSQYKHQTATLAELKRYLLIFHKTLGDTINIWPNYLGNTFYVLVGLKNNNKYIITDKNQNNDFGDDDVQSYTMEQQNLVVNSKGKGVSIPQQEITYKKVDNSKIITQIEKLQIVPYYGYYSKYTDSTEKHMEVALKKSNSRLGEIVIQNKLYKVAVINTEIINPFFNNYNTLIKLSTTDKIASIYIRSSLFHLEQEIQINSNKVIKFIHVDTLAHNITYNIIKKDTIYGIKTFQLFPAHSFYDYQADKDVTINYTETKYTLIDFWGSWCSPCIESLPNLRSLYEEYSQRKNIRFMSIAYDEKDKVDKIKEILMKNKIAWPGVIDDKKLLGASFEKKYQVNVYPTVIVLNKYGKVLFNSTDTSGIDNIRAFLEGLK